MNRPTNAQTPMDSNGVPGDSGLACWLEAVRHRRAQLETGLRAGERARAVLDQILSVRRQMSGLAEDLYGSAWAALERASSDLAEFDRQSQGALDESKKRLREAGRQLFSHVAKDAPEKPGKSDSEVRQLEQEHRDAQAADARLLEERLAARAPLEARYAAAARDLLFAGQALILSLEADRPRLNTAIECAAGAENELRDIARIEARNRPVDPEDPPRLGGPR
jgi:hypothetical protein